MMGHWLDCTAGTVSLVLGNADFLTNRYYAPDPSLLKSLCFCSRSFTDFAACYHYHERPLVKYGIIR